MKNILKSQLESYKRDNTESSKEAILSTIDSISNTMTGSHMSTVNTIEEARRALRSNRSNKSEIVQSVENVISSLK